MANKSSSQIERETMYHWGTLKWKPTPRVLLQAAHSDLLTIQHNAKVKQMKAQAQAAGASKALAGDLKKTAFLAKHVTGAKTEMEILQRALEGLKDGKAAKQIETRYLYDAETIQSAIDHLKSILANDVPGYRV